MKLTAIGGCIFVAGLLPWFVMFDIVVNRLSKTRYETWVNLGRPSGFFMSPADTSLWGTMSRSRLSRSLLFGTPAWVAGDPKAVALVCGMHWLYAISCVGWLILLAGLVI